MKPLLIYLVVFSSCSLYHYSVLVFEEEKKQKQIFIPKNEEFSFHSELYLVCNYEIFYVNSSLRSSIFDLV